MARNRHIGLSKRLYATALILCVFTTSAASNEKCRTGCHGVTPNIFKYQEGTTYKYNLEGVIDISLSSAESQHTSTKLLGQVQLTQHADCLQTLRLQNIQVVGPDAKKYPSLPDIDKPIVVNFHDGHVEPVLCTDPLDTQHSLNIKRAVVSMFQAVIGGPHQKATEEDVFGSCQGDVTSRKDGNQVIVNRHRDLTRCSNREAVRQDLMSTSFNLHAVAGTGPVFATYDSEQRIKNGILDQVVVTENYLYKPFSDGKAHGAKAAVTTKLTFAGQKKETVNAPKATYPRSIHFESPHQETLKTANVDSILNAMKETKKTMDVSVSERSAETFLQLIRVLRASRKEDILAVYGQIKTGASGFKDKEAARKVYFDALFRTGTGEAVEVIVELLKNKELSAVEQKLVYLSFSFIRHATKGALVSAAALLDQPDLPREAYLGIGSLAGRFCQEHPCENVDELSKLQAKLATKLQAQPGSRKAENEVIAALKSLGNMKHLTDAAADKISGVFSAGKAPTRVRVAALEAAAGDACHQKILTSALNLLKNKQEDSELRIKAYLTLVECPDQKLAQAIKELIDSEPTYQVGGYIISHLRNLRASTNPSRERAQQYLSHIRPAKEFPVDPRKYSNNAELSFAWDTLGAAGNVDADVIYSHNSWLPRSVALNVSGDVLGHRYPFVEVDVRQENLDKVVEHYFGPLGVLRSQSPSEVYKTGKESVEKIVEHVKQRLEKTRNKRDVSKAELEAFAKSVKILGSEFNKDLDLDLNVKIFGSELLFLSLNEDIQKLTPDAIIDKLFDGLDSGLDKAKNFEYHLKNHLLLADIEVSYPTSTGFPLRWSLQGTAAVHFITSGQVDIRQILKDPKNAQVHIKLIPSANVEFSGGITVDSHFVTTGLKITANVLTSTGTDVTVKMLDNKGVDVKLGLPVEKQKLVSFSHSLVFATQELGKPEIVQQLKFKDKPREFSICFDQLSPLIGLTFCGEFNAPSTIASNHVGFPLNGNINLEVSIEREDVSEYHFKALLNEPNAHTKSLELTFNTPNSQTNRHLTLILEASAPPSSSKYLRATLKSPFKDAVAEAVLTDSAAEKSAMVRFQHDKQEYLAKIGVSVKGGGDRQVYEPLIELQTPSDVIKTKGDRKPDYSVEGQVIVEGSKYTFDKVKLIAPGQPNIVINGYLAKEGPTSYSTDLEVSRDSVNVHGKGKLQFGKDHLKLNAELQNSVNPNGNFNIKLDLKKGEREFDNSLILIHGPDLSSKKHQLTLSQSFKYTYESKDNFNVQSNNKISYPLVGLEVKLDGSATQNHYTYDLTLGYDKFKLESELDAKLAEKQLGDYDVKFEVEVLKNKLEIKAKREIEGEKSKISNLVEITGRKYQLDGTVTHHIKPNDINIGTDLTIKVHDKPEAIKIDTGLISNTHNLDSHAIIELGSNKIVDIIIKGSRGANPSGTLKINLQNIVNANGNFKVTGGKGTGQIVVDIPKADRKIKAEGQFTCQSPTHNAVLNIFFDFEKDNNNKLHIETKNEVTQNSFDTKNKIDLIGHVVTFNSIGKLEGTVIDGTMTGKFDLTLPNNDVISGNLNRELHTVDNVANGKASASLQHKHGDKTRKLDIKAALKDTNFKVGVFDGEWNFVASDNNKDVKFDLVLKHQHEGEKHNSLYKGTLHGSVLPHALSSSVSGVYTSVEGQHDASLLYGTHGIKIHSKYNAEGLKHPGKTASGGLDVELVLDNKNVKLGVEASGKRPEEPTGDYEGAVGITGTLNSDKTIKLSSNVKASVHNGELHINLEVPEQDPIGLGAKYNREKTETGGKIHGEVDLKYGKGKQVQAGLTLNKVNEEEADLELNLVTPSETAKNINIQLKNKQHNRHFNNELIVTVDGKRYAGTSELVISEVNPSVDITATYPDGKQSRILAKFNRLGPKQFKTELKLINIQDLSLEANGDAQLDSVDDFHISGNIHSEKLKLNKIKFEASNKPAKGGKKIHFSAKSADKNLLSGSTSYKANEEGGKLIVEGSGSVKVKDETRTATFKYIMQQLEQEKDGEQGMEVLLNAGIGSQGIVAELKLTNKQFRLLNSYCEEKKQCAHVELFSKTNTVDAEEFNHELEINIDLRKLGLSHEFGLKSVTTRKNLVLDHTVDVHFESSASSKYQYSLYIHPKEAGIQFTTPKRVVSLEAKGDLSKDKVHGEVALYLNKNAEPNKKTVLVYNCNHHVDDNAGNANIELKFATPSVAKEMIVTYVSKYDISKKTGELSIELDVFAKKNQKIYFQGSTRADKVENGYKVTSDFTLGSKGMNMDIKGSEIVLLTTTEYKYDAKISYQREKSKYDDAILLVLNPKKVELLVKALNKNLIHIESNLDITKESQVADTKLSIIGVDDLVIHAESKNFNTFIATIAKKAAPQNKLRLSTGVILGQIADIRAEIERGGSKTDIAHASLKLDDVNFLKPDFNVNTEVIQKQLIPAVQKQHQNTIEKLKTVAEETNKIMKSEMQHINEVTKKSVPNLKPAVEYYKQEFNKVKDELVSDKTIQEISDLFKKIVGAVLSTLSEIYTKLVAIAEQISAISTEHFTKLMDIISKDILPQVKEVANKLLTLYLDIFNNIYDIVMIYVVKLTEILKQHQDEIKKMANVLSEAFQDFGRLFIKMFNQLREEAQELFKKLYDQMKASPVFEELKQKYEDLVGGLGVGAIPDQILAVLNEFCTTVKEVMPTEEAKHFITVLQDYIGRKLRKEQIDDTESLKQIYASFVKAVNSLIKFVQNQQPGAPTDLKSLLQNIVPFSFSSTSLPQITPIKFSPVNLLLGGGLPSLKQLIWNKSFHLKDNVPPFRHHGIVVQGQHIFTFDDRHLTFPGKCSYVLAKDAVNGNFTVAASYKTNGLESITFSDKHDLVTIKSNLEVLFNGQKTELPIRTGHMDVFRTYRTIEIVSKAGVHIIASPQLQVLSVYVSGFYHSQLRGLLGNGNFEPYDDFILPNGKITANEADFGNGYKLQASCAAVKTVDHSSHQKNAKCDELFGEDSDFILCYPFVHPEGYKQACEHGLAAGIPETEKYIAGAYTIKCQQKNIPIEMPDEFIQCMNSEAPKALNDKFSVKVPNKAADIVVVVEQNKANEAIYKELVQPVITQLSNDLKAKGVTDIEISVIGYGGPYTRYPSHVTQSGGKLSTSSSISPLKFADSTPREPIDTGCKQLDSALDKFFKILDDVQYQLLLTPEADALREGLSYPWRSNAARTVIWVRGQNKPIFSPIRLIGRYVSEYSRKDGIHLSVVQPLDNLKQAAKMKVVVGFNDRGAFLLADAKKKSIEGNDEVKNDMDWGLDHAVDYVIERFDGNVFLTNNFLAAKGGQKKQFVQVMSHVLSENILNIEYGMDCECERVSPLSFGAKNVCKVVNIKEKEPRKGGVKG